MSKFYAKTLQKQSTSFKKNLREHVKYEGICFLTEFDIGHFLATASPFLSSLLIPMVDLFFVVVLLIQL